MALRRTPSDSKLRLTQSAALPPILSRRRPFRLRSRRVALGLLLLTLVVWRFYLSRQSTTGPRLWSWAGTACLKQLPAPTSDSLYSFIDGISDYTGHYIPLRFDQRGHTKDVPQQIEEEVPNASPACLDDHISKGLPCDLSSSESSISSISLDVVYAYVNGSDPLHHAAYYATRVRMPPKVRTTPSREPALLRELDELRFSVRSVLENLRSSIKQIIIISPEFAFPGCKEQRSWRLGQLPQWLLPTHKLRWKDGKTTLSVVHHSQIFGEFYDPPTFNSLAIESRLPYLEGHSDNFIYLNDDIFLAAQFSSGDFYTSTTGPILRIQPDLLINPNRPRVGEWMSLAYTNELLDKRFGERYRPYIVHNAKTLSKTQLKEVSTVWKTELDATALHRYRAEKLGDKDVSITVLMSHWIVERWREALLWSFIVASVGGDDDQWGGEQLQDAWARLGGDPKRRDLGVQRGRRETLNSVNRRSTGAKQTKLVFSSFDGYPYTGMGRSGFKEFPDLTLDDSRVRGAHQASHCTISQQTCFSTPGQRIPSASEIFKNVAFRHPSCGDCIIGALATRSGKLGLTEFLPNSERRFPTKSRPAEAVVSSIARLPMSAVWETTDFTLRGVSTSSTNVRQWTLQALHRYRFAIGSTPAEFVKMETPIQVNATLNRLDSSMTRDDIATPALICLNDDVRWQPEILRDVLGAWMSQRWSSKAAWEV